MSESQVELVKQKSDIVTVIDSRVKLSKSGRNLKANCPFHGEKTPSFFVSPELQTFKCFGCGEGGDVFTFLQKYEGMDFPEALEFLAQKAGITLKREFRSDDEQDKKRWLEILHLAEEYYHFLLTKHAVGAQARDYLSKRGIAEGILTTFKLGYAPESWQGLQDFLVKKKQYKVEDLESTGMVLRSSAGRYYDRFRDRIIFPLKDFSGKTVGFSGRILPSVDPETRSGQEKEAKYINSPETKIYHKSQMLYGLSEVRSTIRKKNKAVVVEGEFDMISSYVAGVREVVAIKGSALTTEQIELLRRLTPNIVLALDADSAGSEATKRGIRTADQMGMSLSVVEVVDGKDPDELAQKNPELWKKLISTPESVYDFLIKKSFETFDARTGEGKKAISRELAPVLSQISNAVEREHYLGVIATKLSVPKKALEDEVVKIKTLGVRTQNIEQPEEQKMNRRQKLERFVLGSFLQLQQSLNDFSKKIHPELFSDTGLKKLWLQVDSKLTEKPAFKVRELVAALPMESQRLVQELFSPDVVLSASNQSQVEEMFEEGLNELKKLEYKERLNLLSGQMGAIEDMNESEVLEIQREYGELTRKLKELEV